MDFRVLSHKWITMWFLLAISQVTNHTDVCHLIQYHKGRSRWPQLLHTLKSQLDLLHPKGALNPDKVKGFMMISQNLTSHSHLTKKSCRESKLRLRIRAKVKINLSSQREVQTCSNKKWQEWGILWLVLKESNFQMWTRFIRWVKENLKGSRMIKIHSSQDQSSDHNSRILNSSFQKLMNLWDQIKSKSTHMSQNRHMESIWDLQESIRRQERPWRLRWTQSTITGNK